MVFRNQPASKAKSGGLNMANNTLGVVVRLAVNKGQEDEFSTTAMKAMVEPTQTVQGCIKYEMWQDHEEPWRFVILEEWEDEKSHAAHLASDWLQPVMASLMGYASEPFEMQRLHQTH